MIEKININNLNENELYDYYKGKDSSELISDLILLSRLDQKNILKKYKDIMGKNYIVLIKKAIKYRRRNKIPYIVKFGVGSMIIIPIFICLFFVLTQNTIGSAINGKIENGNYFLMVMNKKDYIQINKDIYYNILGKEIVILIASLFTVFITFTFAILLTIKNVKKMMETKPTDEDIMDK